jgi:hypothetical protein
LPKELKSRNSPLTIDERGLVEIRVERSVSGGVEELVAVEFVQHVSLRKGIVHSIDSMAWH